MVVLSPRLKSILVTLLHFAVCSESNSCQACSPIHQSKQANKHEPFYSDRKVAEDSLTLLVTSKCCFRMVLSEAYSLFVLSGSRSPTSCLARSLRIFRRILPDGFFGISLTTTTPPSNRLCLLTRSASQLAISFGEGAWSFCKLMYARGSSSPDLIATLAANHDVNRESNLCGGHLHCNAYNGCV